MDLTLEERLEVKHESYRLSSEPLERESYFDAYASAPAEGKRSDERYHEASKLDAPTRRRLRESTARFAEVACANTSPRPDYPKAETVDLPPVDDLDADLWDALDGRRSVREFTGEGLSRESLAALTAGAFGTSEERRWTHDGRARRKELRRYPSAGGLYPVEAYVLLFEGSDLESGLYYYVPGEHALRALDRERDPGEHVDSLFATLGDRSDLASAGAAFVFTAAFERTRAKYGPRGYRFVLQESGHAAQNLQLVASALGLGSVPWGGYRDGPLNEYLGVDGVTEAVVYAVFVGGRDD